MNKILYDAQYIRADSEDGKCLLEIENLCISENEFIIIAGPNGSGKTLLLRSLLGLLHNKRNRVSFLGDTVNKPLSQVKTRISYVPQHPENYILGLTVREDLKFSISDDVLFKHQKLLEKLGLFEIIDRSTMLLSGGEKRKLSLASALVTSPQIIFFDEPFTELDYKGICEFTKLLIELKESGICVVLITHDLSKVLNLATRVIFLKNGNIIFDGLPSCIFNVDTDFGVRIPKQKLEECTWLQ